MTILLLLSFLFAAACVYFIVVAVRDRSAAPLGARPHAGDELHLQLARRLAAGEMTPEDYRARVRALQETGMLTSRVEDLVVPPLTAPEGAVEPVAYHSAVASPPAVATPDSVTFGAPLFVSDHDAIPATAPAGDGAAAAEQTMPLPRA